MTYLVITVLRISSRTGSSGLIWDQLESGLINQCSGARLDCVLFWPSRGFHHASRPCSFPRPCRRRPGTEVPPGRHAGPPSPQPHRLLRQRARGRNRGFRSHRTRHQPELRSHPERCRRPRPRHQSGNQAPLRTGGALELSIDSVRLTDGRPIPLRATPEKGPNDMSGARVAATIAASPILVWVKGKDVTFEKGTESTAYVNGDARIEEPQPRTVAGMPVESAADRSSGPGTVLTNDDIVQMQKARLSEEIILSKIATSATNFNTETQDLIRLKEAGVNDNIINAMVQKSSRR